MYKSGEITSSSRRLITARADYYTSDESILVFLDMPGVFRDDVNIRLENRMLHVEGPHSKDGSITYRRTISVNDSFDASKTQASVDRGVVRLEIPKKPEAKPVRIAVNPA